MFLQKFLHPANEFIPPMTEVYHYPYLMTGWFGLLITAMNMIPVGQLDGGHIVYSMFGTKIQETVASIILNCSCDFRYFGFVDVSFEMNFGFGWSGWIFWGLILFFIIKVKHPPVRYFRVRSN